MFSEAAAAAAACGKVDNAPSFLTPGSFLIGSGKRHQNSCSQFALSPQVYDLDHDPGESTPLAAEAFDQVPLVLPLAVIAKARKEESYRQTQSMYASRVAELEAEMLKAAERKVGRGRRNKIYSALVR